MTRLGRPAKVAMLRNRHKVGQLLEIHISLLPIMIKILAHQNRERIPERPVHAKGWGAHGTLTITGDISKYTKAKVLQKSAKTPMIARFSTLAGELGAADAERDMRGFAL